MLTVFLLYKYTKSHSENASENSLRVLLEVCLVFQEGFASQCRKLLSLRTHVKYVYHAFAINIVYQ